MPSHTFLNLPEAKQKRLLDAAKEEFSRHLMEEASINQIIKSAGISRGSFYMYFKDKEDLYRSLLKQYHEDLLKRILHYLDATNGDFIKTWELLFDEIFAYCSKNENIDFFRHIFLNLRFSTEHKREHGYGKEEKEKWKKTIIKHIRKDLYRFKNDEVLSDAFEMVMMMTNMSLVSTFMELNSIETAKQKFHDRMKIMKYGLYKEEEKEK